MSAALHPRRGAPLCKDCVHVDAGPFRKMACNHPSTPVSQETGVPLIPAECMRGGNTVLRIYDIAPCGVEGSLFSAKQPASVITPLAEGGGECSQNADVTELRGADRHWPVSASCPTNAGGPDCAGEQE